MNRYQIALGKDPEQARKENQIKTFGFGDDFAVIKGVIPKSHLRDLFHLQPSDGEKRIGFLYRDPLQMFKGAWIHYNTVGRYYFRCLNNSKVRTIAPGCCSDIKMFSKRAFRMACVIIVYGVPDTNYEVMPWVFGPSLQKKLETIKSQGFSLDNDFKISCTNDRFKNYNITPYGSSIWAQWESQDVLKKADGVFPVLEKYLGHKHTNDELTEIVFNHELKG